ncbi:MAG: DNA/RNA nuclease SfsA [Spirochaetales bacterium]|nr:DNA/RNA nuclease SfsA [Spirochaetales bacterium]
MPDSRTAYKLFSPDVTGVFAGRPNRFEILVRTGDGTVRAHCPNPGRMQEILLPDTPVILERAVSTSRSTAYTFVAAIHHGKVIGLHSTRTNPLAGELVLPRLFERTETIRREVSFGTSRYDFAAETDQGAVLVEVKSCTLCEEGVAMFPDAPTSRGVKHILHMAQLVREKKVAGGIVLFIVGNPSARVFIPNIHTDQVFSKALTAAAPVLTVKACSISVTAEGIAAVTNDDVPVFCGPVRLVEQDCGVYLLVLYLKEDRTVATGGLGGIAYKRGWYVYAGSAKRGLSSRIRRHQAKRKTTRWHIDYLSLAADSIRAFPVYTDLDIECELASSVRDTGGTGVKGFGSSDCSCESHLFWFEDDPFGNRAFTEMLFFYRHRRALEAFLT